MATSAVRVVVVTGASGNLGQAVVRAFAAAGDEVVRVDRSARAAGSALHVAVDLTDAADARRIADATLARFGRVDALCNLAGGFAMGEDVHATSDATWKRMWDLNVATMVNASHALVPAMLARGRGAIVNVGAFGALKGGAGMGAYAAAKSAVMRLTESMSAELRDRGIHVNAVLPTTLDTPQNREAMPQADPARWVALDDLAAVIVFLASDRARAIHGALVPVTGLG